MLCRNDQIVGLRYQHLDHVDTVAKVMFTRVQRLLFYYFVHELLILHLFIGSREPFNFLVKGARRGAAFLLPYYEVGALHVIYERILANIL
jgi:hypothetical protein